MNLGIKKNRLLQFYLTIFNEEELDFTEFEDLIGAIVTMGRLPDGIYEFSIKLSDFLLGFPVVNNASD